MSGVTRYVSMMSPPVGVSVSVGASNLTFEGLSHTFNVF